MMKSTLIALSLGIVFTGATTFDFRVMEKDAAIASYNDYLNYEISEIGWTGSSDKCKGGAIADAAMANALSRINLFREMAGLNSDITFSDEYNELSQAAALIMHANNRLSHKPNSGWKCYTKEGEEGAVGSNLSQLANNDLRHIIGDLIEDPGKYNQDVGHRRWLLNSAASVMGFGATDTYYSIYVTGVENRDPVDDAPEFVAWPPAGYMPYQLVYKRWSFGIPIGPEVSFKDADVSVTANGKKLGLTVESTDANFADPTIVWSMNEMKEEFFYDYYDMDVKKANMNGQGMLDSKIVVSVENVMIDGESKDFEYEVWIIDPNE